ncbi:MAG: RHS repeat-associated core domain-containing protein [Akkermansia sp.]
MTKISATSNRHRYNPSRGYLQIVALDKKRSTLNTLWLLHWNPTESIAIRPLSIRKNATWYTYGHDLTKNVTEFYNTNGTIATAYDYTPYGAVTATGIDQPFQWSSEVYDAELGMVYYNYRHYNHLDGRWISKDPFHELGGINLYGFVENAPSLYVDYNGRFFEIGTLVGAAIGGIVGAITGAMKDGWKGAVAGGIGGAVASAVTQVLSGEDPMSPKGGTKVAISAFCGCLTGGVCSKIRGNASTEMFGQGLNGFAAVVPGAMEVILDIGSGAVKVIEKDNKKYDCFK